MAPDAAQSAPVRSLLAAYLDQPSASVRIERGEHGKPRVAAAQLEFNLSHAGGALLLGVSRRIVLGVDLESTRRKTRPAVELARRFFAPAEARALEALPESLRQAAFLRLWCAKEAALKAHGRGIGFGLERIEFALDAAGGVAPAAGNPWRTVALAPSPEHVGALAHAGLVSQVCAFVVRN
ncbi:MAG TPA: 4'-phosphopantetheinyl transferase superfamily protein [Rudaea sp.]|nr:4'-phosphopantetheinyl transferase superfamily protein [Rudaea sp.]